MKFKKLNETYWIDNKEVMDQVSKLGKELESDGFKFYSDRHSGSTYYDFYTKRGDTGAICKAVQYSYDGAQIIDITIDQLMGKEPIDSFETMRRKLGKMLLPRNEAMEEDKEDKFVLYFPYLEPRIISKDRAIKQMEFELNEFKNNSGASVAGKGFGIYCLQSYDPDTDSVWEGRYSSKEFLKVLDESMLNEDIDDSIWSLGHSNMSFADAKKHFQDLRADIKLLFNCETVEEVFEHESEFKEFNCANIIKRKLDKGMSPEDALDFMSDYLMRTWNQWKTDMAVFKSNADKAMAAFNAVKNALSQYELISADEERCVLKYRPIEGATHKDCIEFVDAVVAAVNGKYDFTGRGGSWTRWDIRTADGVMLKAGWDDHGDTWSVTFPRLKFEALTESFEMAAGGDGDDFDGEIAAMRAEQKELEARRAARKERFALMHKLFDKHMNADPNAKWIDKIYDLFEDAEKVMFIGNKYGTLPGKTEDGQPIKYRYSIEEYNIYTDPYREFVYITTNKNDLSESMESGNKMTITIGSSVNADGCTIVVTDESDKILFKEKYSYGYNASYNRKFASIYPNKPFIGDIVNELCTKFHVNKNDITYARGTNVFNGTEVSDKEVSRFVELINEDDHLNEFTSWSRYHIVTSDGETIDSYTDYKDAEDWVKQLYKDGDFKRGELTIVDSYKKKQTLTDSKETYETIDEGKSGSLNEDTQLKLDDDMINDIDILYQWRPEEVEKILVKHGSNPNNDTWDTGLDLPAAYDEIMSTFRDKYSDYDEIDYNVAKVLGLAEESLKEDLEDDFDLYMKASDFKCKLSRYDIEEAANPDELIIDMEDVYSILSNEYGAENIKWWKFYEDDDVDFGYKVCLKDGSKHIVEINNDRVDEVNEALEEKRKTQYVICGVTNKGTRMLYDAVNDNFTTDYASATKYDDMDVARDDWFKIPRSGFRRIFIPVYDPAVFESVKEAFDADKVQKRIACTTEFDNGHVFHNDYFRASSAEAEERAKQASIENPNKVFYVKYDDVMNPSSDIKWKNGEQLNEADEPIYFDPDDESEVDFRYYVYANNDDVVSDAFDFEEDAISWAQENNYPIVKIHNYYRDTDGELNPDGNPEIVWKA